MDHALIITETQDERCARLRDHFANAHWPVPWRVVAEPRGKNGLRLYFIGKAYGLFETANISLSFRRDHTYVNGFFLPADEQNAGAGRQLAAFLFDELAGQGETSIRLLASGRGGYFWARMGMLLKGGLPTDIIIGLATSAMGMKRGERKAWLVKAAKIIWGKGKREDRLWVLSQQAEQMESGEKAAQEMLYNSVWRARFDATNPACVSRLKTYVPGYKFRHL